MSGEGNSKFTEPRVEAAIDALRHGCTRRAAAGLVQGIDGRIGKQVAAAAIPGDTQAMRQIVAQLFAIKRLQVVLEGDALKTSGCVFGGLICKSVNWTRLK